MAAWIIIVGGEYGGIAVAKARDGVADVVLVKPLDVFVHNVCTQYGRAGRGEDLPAQGRRPEDQHLPGALRPHVDRRSCERRTQ